MRRKETKAARQAIEALMHPEKEERYRALAAVKQHISSTALIKTGTLTDEVNNHIHTWYSFSPYSPAMAAYKAWDAGLAVCGIVDHESIAGGKEMKDACSIFSLGATLGCELRVSFSGTPMEGRKLNNPNIAGVAYTVIHGIADTMLPQLDAFLLPIRAARAQRSEEETAALSLILQKASLPAISFKDDVLPISHYHAGGTVTERHILYALSQKLILHFGKGRELLDLLRAVFNIIPSGKNMQRLLDKDNPYYAYDLLGLLKSTFLAQIYVAPHPEECLPVHEAVQFARDIHAIPAYPYLGDITDSITGDKKTEKFEDDFLDALFACISKLGYQACTYMPPRNTAAQLDKLRKLCTRYGLMEISGVDINSPRQEFLYRHPACCAYLIDSAWALVAHEHIVRTNPAEGLFGRKITEHNLLHHLTHYASLGKQIIHTL